MVGSADAGIPAYLGARRRRDVGCKMAFGVSRREVVRPLVLGRLSSGGWQQQGCGELVADHRWWTPARPPIGDRLSGGGVEGHVAGVSQRVIAAANELAGDGDQGDVRLEAQTKPLVVGVVG